MTKIKRMILSSVLSCAAAVLLIVSYFFNIGVLNSAIFTSVGLLFSIISNRLYKMNQDVFVIAIFVYFSVKNWSIFFEI